MVIGNGYLTAYVSELLYVRDGKLYGIFVQMLSASFATVILHIIECHVTPIGCAIDAADNTRFAFKISLALQWLVQ